MTRGRIAMGRPNRRKLEAVQPVRKVVPQRQCGVLVVEDDPDLQWRLARMLTVQGSRVVGTSSGDGALALVAQWPVDLVLVDQDLPGMSGLEVARRLRETHPDIPVVLMIRDDRPEVQEAAREAGAVACLVKPFEVDALFDLLMELAIEAPMNDVAPQAAMAEPAE